MPEYVPGTNIYRIVRHVNGRRYRVSSGTSNDKEFKLRDVIVTKLLDGGDEGLATLRLLTSKMISWADLVKADKDGKLQEMSSRVHLFLPLQQTFDDWLATHTSHRRGRPLAPRTSDRYRESWTRFTKLATEMKLLPANAVVGDLVRVNWAKLRANWGASGYDWNNFRRTLSVFLNNALNRGLEETVAKQVMRIVPSPERFARRRDAPCSEEEMWRIIDHAPRALRAGYSLMFRLAIGPDTYLRMTRQHLEPLRGIVHMPDDKNEYRSKPLKVPKDSDLWPWLLEAVPCPIGEQMLRRHWNAAVKAAGIPRRVRLYDLRHLVGIYLAERGIPLQEIATFMRHASVNMTWDYVAGMETRAANLMLDQLLAPKRAMLLPPPAATQSSDSPASGDPESSA